MVERTSCIRAARFCLPAATASPCLSMAVFGTDIPIASLATYQKVAGIFGSQNLRGRSHGIGSSRELSRGLVGRLSAYGNANSMKKMRRANAPHPESAD